jgi:hypothetical protein
MTESVNPGAISQGPNRGWGFVLDHNIGLGPLRTLQQQDALKAIRQQQAQKQKQAAIDKAGKLLTDTGQASLLYKEKEALKTEQFFNDLTNLSKEYQAGKLNDYDFRMQTERKKHDLATWKQSTNQLETARQQLESAIKNPLYNGAKIREIAQNVLLDDKGELKDNPGDIDYITKTQQALNDPENLNKGEAIKQFYQRLQQQAFHLKNEHGDITEDVTIKNKLPLLFETDERGIRKPVRDPQTHNYLFDPERTADLVKADPILSRIVDSEYAKQQQLARAASAFGQPVQPPTYQEVLVKTFADNNPVEYAYNLTRDEPRLDAIKKAEEKKLLQPSVVSRESTIAFPVSKDGAYTGEAGKPVKNVAIGYEIKSKVGSNIVNYVPLSGIPSSQVTYTDGRKPDTQNTRPLDVDVHFIGYGLLSGNGSPLRSASIEDQIQYIKTRLNKPEDFQKVKLGFYAEGSVLNKVNRLGEVPTTLDNNKLTPKEARRADDPRLDEQTRVLLKLDDTLKKALKARTGLDNYDNLQVPAEAQPLLKAYINQWKIANGEKVNNTQQGGLDPLSTVIKAGRVRLGKGSLDNIGLETSPTTDPKKAAELRKKYQY